MGDDGEPWPLITENNPIPTVTEYVESLQDLMLIVQNPACKSLAYKRLRYLEQRFALHQMYNGEQEMNEVRNNNHRDFYNVRKVDVHVHHSACMTQKHLLRFIRKKFKTESKRVVAKDKDGNPLTLEEIFQNNLGLSAYEMSIDHLDVHALNSCFQRFDLFNAKYNPVGAAMLRDVFLKTDNLLGGQYLAEITQEVMKDLQDAKYQHVEWRISIYGHSKSEWSKLASWLKNHQLYSKNVRWIIQVPRLYYIYKKRGILNSMQDFLDNQAEAALESLLTHEKGPSGFVCQECKSKPSPSLSMYRCFDCYMPTLLCGQCIVETHCHNPFHFVQEWELKRHFWLHKPLMALGGIVLQLSHEGYLCQYSTTPSRSMCIGLEHGIHDVPVRFCACRNPVTDKLIPESMQLLHHGFWPASWNKPHTAFTVRLLKDFQLLSNQIHLSSYDFYKVMRRKTDNIAPQDVTVCVLFMAWHVRMLTSSGRIAIANS